MHALDPFRRHDWVWLTAEWEAHLRTPLDPVGLAQVRTWLAGGRPLVVSRHWPGDQADGVRLGLALPGRRRIGLHLSAQAVSGRSLPPSIPEVRDSAPQSWWEVLDWLAALSLQLGMVSGVYGSLAWQHFAGAAEGGYLNEQSDLDLLFMPSSWQKTEMLVAALARYDGPCGHPRLDGEVILPDGGGIAWRELLGRPAEVLVKSMGHVELRPCATLPGAFDTRAA